MLFPPTLASSIIAALDVTTESPVDELRLWVNAHRRACLFGALTNASERRLRHALVRLEKLGWVTATRRGGKLWYALTSNLGVPRTPLIVPRPEPPRSEGVGRLTFVLLAGVLLLTACAGTEAHYRDGKFSVTQPTPRVVQP